MTVVVIQFMYICLLEELFIAIRLTVTRVISCCLEYTHWSQGINFIETTPPVSAPALVLVLGWL